MGVGFQSYEIARSGLYVSERGLFVTGHNISNVNTPGYVRQQSMQMEAAVLTQPTRYGIMQLGLGAGIQETRQIRHVFLDNVFRRENTTLGYWETRQKTFQDVQAIMAEPMESGLQDVLNQFWDSWQELSKEPDSLTIRAVVRQRTEALVRKINQMGTQLDSLQDNLNSELAVKVGEVNEITGKIAELNKTILRYEANGDSANDYRDQRNALIDRLTKLVKADVTEMQDGQVDITVGGYFLVQKDKSTNLYAAERNPGERFYVVKLGGTNIEVPMKGGIIKGLMESRGEVNGAVGSYENGTPNTKADVVFYIDTSVMSVADATLRMNKYIEELEKKGIDANVQIKDVTSAAEFEASVTGTSGLRADANKYAVLITDESLAPADLESLRDKLADLRMDASVVTNNPAAWTALTDELDGGTYSLTDFASTDDATYTALAQSIAADTNDDVSAEYSVISDSLNIVSDMKARLNALINTALREINYLHKSGMTMTDPPTQGGDLFIVKYAGRPLEMGNIQLNPNLSDLSNIAASKTGSNGDNTNALEIANLRNKAFINDDTGITSIDNYYQAIILHMRNGGADADRITDSQGKLVQSADASRTSISGVSMDEEMTNMMKYKFAYDAASRALNVIDDMMETVINRMGLVGR